MKHGFRRHPLSKLFGDMSQKALGELAKDVEIHGILEPVVLHEGMVLDGWHRCKAGQMAVVDIPTVEFDGDDPAAFVISKNLHRRQQPLSASQRAMIVVEANSMQRRGNQIGTGADSASHDELADQAQTSKRTITDARAAKDAGLTKEVLKGKLSAKGAARQARSQNEDKNNTATEKPKSLSPLGKAKTAIAELREQNSGLRESIDELTDELQSYLDISPEEKEQQVKLAQLRTRIRTLESQVNEHKQIANIFKRDCRALRKRLGE